MVKVMRFVPDAEKPARRHRPAARAGLVVGLLLALLVPGGAPAQDDGPAFRVLLFSKTAAFRHDSIPAGIAAIEKLGRENGFAVDATEDGAQFTDANLGGYDVVVFLSTTGDVLTDEQQAAFERYMRAGGGYLGIHAAADTEYEWPFYGEMVGAYFRGHPHNQDATIDVEDRTHPSTAHLPERWDRFDEWYNYKAPESGAASGPDYSPRPDVHVLATLDESTYLEGDDSDLTADDHPIAWYREFEGGRSFYTGGGHTVESYEEEDFLKHLLGGLRWAAGPPKERESAPPANESGSGSGTAGEGGGSTGDAAPPAQQAAPGGGLALAVALDRRRLERALRLGLRARVNCSAECAPRLALRASAAAARRHGLSSRDVARGGAGSKFSGRRTFLLQFSAEARRRLEGVGRLRLTLVGSATDAAGRSVGVRQGVTLR